MAVRNLMEDIVLVSLDEVLKNEKDSEFLRAGRDDILAYVLNRVPPKYATGERGILHGKIESRFEIQQKTDIFLLIYEAVGLFKNRRSSGNTFENVKNSNCFKCFPHIIGQVLEETTFSIVPDIKVTLKHNKTIVKMVSNEWSNPYLTNIPTMGYYHFWPEFDIGHANIRSFDFSLVFSHPKFNERTVEIRVEPTDSMEVGISKIIPIVLLSLKDGVSSDFLVEKGKE